MAYCEALEALAGRSCRCARYLRSAARDGAVYNVDDFGMIVSIRARRGPLALLRIRERLLRLTSGSRAPLLRGGVVRRRRTRFPTGRPAAEVDAALRTSRRLWRCRSTEPVRTGSKDRRLTARTALDHGVLGYVAQRS